MCSGWMIEAILTVSRKHRVCRVTSQSNAMSPLNLLSSVPPPAYQLHPGQGTGVVLVIFWISYRVDFKVPSTYLFIISERPETSGYFLVCVMESVVKYDPLVRSFRTCVELFWSTLLFCFPLPVMNYLTCHHDSPSPWRAEPNLFTYLWQCSVWIVPWW